MAFRVDGQGNLIAFAGRKCHEVTIDGRKTVFADADLDEIGWAPVAPRGVSRGRHYPDCKSAGTGTVRIPAAGLPAELTLFVEGPKPGSRGERPFLASREGDTLVFNATTELRGHWLYGVK